MDNGDAVDTGQSGAARSQPLRSPQEQKQVFAKFKKRLSELDTVTESEVQS